MSDIRAYKTLQRDGWEIWSAEEVANIIDKFHGEIDWDASEAVRQTKRLWPGAEITRVRPKAMADRQVQQRAEPASSEPMAVAVMQRAPARRGRGGGGNWATGWR